MCVHFVEYTRRPLGHQSTDGLVVYGYIQQRAQREPPAARAEARDHVPVGGATP